MLFVITLGIIFGVLRLMRNLGDLALHAHVTKQYLVITSDVLALFILIELSRSLVDYFHEQRLRMTFIVDAAVERRQTQVRGDLLRKLHRAYLTSARPSTRGSLAALTRPAFLSHNTACMLP